MDERIVRSGKLKNLRGNTQWYRITNSVTGPAQIHIYDEIGLMGVSAQSFAADMAGVNGDIDVHINSPGGEVFDGIAIYNTLKNRNGQVSVFVDGIAASAASFIAQAASPGKLTMSKHGTMMIHDGMGMCMGNVEDMQQMAQVLDKMSNTIAGIYAERSGKSADHWRGLMKNETWLNADEAVKAGLADSVAGADSMVNEFDLSVFKNAPGDDSLQAAWDPDQDGDDDSSPETDTDHDYWAPDGTQLKPVPGKPMKQSQQNTNWVHVKNRFPELYGHLDSPWFDFEDGVAVVTNADKYSADDRKTMAGKGQAMPDGSYPIADEEDLNNAIHAVGRGNADHDAIRAHVIKRAAALGKSDAVPDNWNSDGSLKSESSNSMDDYFHALRNSLGGK